MFNFPLKWGERETVLNDKNNVVITAQMAMKYFGDTNPVGKQLRVSGGTLSGDFTVSGVLEYLPVNSHLQFDFLMPMKFVLEEWRLYKEVDSEGWKLPEFVTYVQLNRGADLQQVSKKLDQLTLLHMGEFLGQSTSKVAVALQPIADIHLYSNFPHDPASNNGKVQDIHFFALIAIFILLMAWVNYINLATAQAMQRAKEVGVRKSIGALRKQLISQFIIESSLLNAIAAVLAIAIAFLLLPLLNTIIGKEIQFSLLQSSEFWAWFVGAVLLGSLLSGLYPAFILSSFKPVSVFNSGSISQRGGFSLRKSLIVFQFLMSVLLISGTYLVHKQILFMKNKDLGIDMEEILVVQGPRVFLENLPEGEQEVTQYKAFKEELASYHAVSAITCASSVPSKGYLYTEGFRKSGQQLVQNKEANVLLVDTDFTETYGMEFLAKAPYEKEIVPDEKVIINEEALKVFALGSPEEALHKVLVNSYGDTAEIVGVVKNVHWSSLREAHSPHLYILNNSYGAYFSVKVKLSNIQETLSNIESAYHAIFPNDPFDYSFLDDDFNRQYQADLQFGNLFSAFSILAIFIACLGLFALVSYSATLKVKEIGIRKVLGASVGNLMVLLSREYLMLLVLANILAVPAILYWGRSWLDHYAFRIEFGLEFLLVPALVLFVISLLTVGYRTYAAARANPVKSLRKE